jgi:hypothetical protein
MDELSLRLLSLGKPGGSSPQDFGSDMALLAWLKKHPEVTWFAVIDDDDDELDDLPLFQPPPEAGLTGKIADAVCRYLAGETEEDMRSSAVKRLIQNVRNALQDMRGGALLGCLSSSDCMMRTCPNKKHRSRV